MLRGPHGREGVRQRPACPSSSAKSGSIDERDGQSGAQPREVGLGEARDDLEAGAVELDDAEAIGQGPAIARRPVRDHREEAQASRGSDQSRSRSLVSAVRTRRRRRESGAWHMRHSCAARSRGPSARRFEQAGSDRTWMRHAYRPLVKRRMSGQDARIGLASSAPRHGRTSPMRTLITLVFLFVLLSQRPGRRCDGRPTISARRRQDPCVVNTTLTLAPGSVIDLGGSRAAVRGAARVTVGAGQVQILAGPVTPAGRRANHRRHRGCRLPTLEIDSTGSIALEAIGSTKSRIDLSADAIAGYRHAERGDRHHRGGRHRRRTGTPPRRAAASSCSRPPRATSW